MNTSIIRPPAVLLSGSVSALRRFINKTAKTLLYNQSLHLLFSGSILESRSIAGGIDAGRKYEPQFVMVSA
jgi:hypothetical protein